MLSTRLIAVLIGLALLSAGCANDGRDLSAPLDWQTTTTRPLPPTSALDQEVSDSGLSLTSPMFAPGSDIPISATCAGENLFPELAWTGVANSAVELAVTLSDQTDPETPLLLWLMAGIDPSNTGLIEGTMPIGAFETLNDYGNPGYGTPCLETYSDGRRDIQFRVHVLTSPSGIAPGDPGNEAWTTVKAGSVDSAALLARVDSAA
ncbi:MAG: YbhB/YbcL family Raf kinase inhibitor-like protein [Acidimicrobiales bacterium]